MSTQKFNNVSEKNKDTNIFVLPNKASIFVPFFCVLFEN